MSTTPTSSQQPDVPKGPAALRYSSLWSSREMFLIRARRFARLTVPLLYREWGENETTSETVPWQTLGAYGVNTLAAKCVLTLFPSGVPFISLKPTKEALASLASLGADAQGKLRAEIDKGLSAVEVEFLDGVNEDGDRWRIFDALRHLIVGGNHALKFNEDATLQSIPLEQFVTVRDSSGNLMDAVIEDLLSWETLSDNMRQFCIERGYKVEYMAGGNGEPNPIQDPVRVYTRIYRIGPAKKGGQFKVYQEVWGACVPGTEHVWDDDALPYLFLRWVALKKENYGRSFVEDYEGDLQTLDGFWQLLTEGMGSIVQSKWLVKPGGVTNKKQFAELPNGGVMTGDPEDVSMVRSEKSQDIEIGMNAIDRLESRLSRAFLIVERRKGERVTAEEIQGDAQELETSLGGVYANQVTTFQGPFARLKLIGLQRNKRVTQLPKGTTRMTILTGEAGLGRQQKAQTLDEFMETTASAAGEVGQSPIAPYVNWRTYLLRAAANRSIDPDGLIKSDEEVQADQEKAQQQALSQNVAPEVVKQGGQIMQNAQQAGGLTIPGGAPAPAPQQPDQAGA